MAGEQWSRQRYSEEFWRTHHEAWKRSDLNQREYLGDILQRLSDGHPMSRLDDLPPWNWTSPATAAV